MLLADKVNAWNFSRLFQGGAVRVVRGARLSSLAEPVADASARLESLAPRIENGGK
jgi:hypothetical protein